MRSNAQEVIYVDDNAFKALVKGTSPSGAG